MNAIAVIPARYASTRFPGKPLVQVAGVAMLQRVWAIARAAQGVARAVVATDDARIFDFVRGFGGEAVMTPESCRNGTERTHAAVEALGLRDAAVINLQGDAVLTPPWVIGALAAAMARDPDVRVATLATRMAPDAIERLRRQKAGGQAGGTTVTFDRFGDAMYFSKAIIPFVKKPDAAPPIWRHIGIYAFRAETLARYVSLEMGPFEKAEELEQLRALENGIKMRVVPCDYRGRTHWSIDSPDDLREAEAILAREGELLPRYDGTARVE
ncbi:MAG: 3-deoxy-manno-octulosonate cytidylyltransferase [Azospirillum sp.]|nr:3-deoxy-manno-octulosonate cytidylyltransferase [Azospirillum sp.]MCZ8123975.1 3-deoxy-manno-octulosonate cytidylyltransferase [Magnetospirillum sp.]